MLNFAESQTFKFENRDLKEKLCSTAQNNRDGYWKIQLNQPKADQNFYYLYLSKGNIVFSNNDILSLSNVLNTLKRYVPQLRTANSLKVIQEIQANNSDNSILFFIRKLAIKTEIVNYHKFDRAIKLQILDDFDRYLFAQAGQAEFVIDEQIQEKRPIVGFKLNKLIQLAEQRKAQWQQIQPELPASNAIVSCSQNSIWQSINPQQQQRIQKLVGQNQTIEQITYNLGEDRLKVAQSLAQLAKKELITFTNDASFNPSTVTSQSAMIQTAAVADGAVELAVSTLLAQPSTSEKSKRHSAPEIVVIDDSPLLLRNFETIVSGWGYHVRCCEDAGNALEFILAGEPSVIFLDLNMPKISGFQLMKHIRLLPKLASVPLVVLTAEKSMINQQRAKWAKSIFLSKPLQPEQIPTFMSELRAILQELAPISQ